MTNPFNALAQRWRNWKITRTKPVTLDCCGADEAGRVAHDLGVCAPQLRALAGRWPDSAEPLNRRLTGLALDFAQIPRTEPQVLQDEPQALQDMQRVCTMWTLDALAAERAKPARRA
jgi:hypothetical protein